MRIPLAKHHYKLDSRISAQRCVNMYYQKTEDDTGTGGALLPTPGLKLFASVGTGPIWGMHVLNNLLYVVSGNNVYTVDQFGGATDLGGMGTVSNSVVMDDNGTDVCIVLEGGAAYLAQPSSLTQITDGDFRSAGSVTVIDFYGVFNELNSGRYFISDLNDLSSYNPLNFATAEAASDNLVRVFAFNDELWLFGERTTEIHYNSGEGRFPFIPRQNSTLNRGCAAKRTVVQDANTLFWFGDDRIFYMADGYRPKRISTHAIEERLQEYTTISDAESFVYTQNGHKFVVTTFPTEGETWVYDVATQLFHQRQSFEKDRWRAASHAFAYDINLVGDFETGKVYELDLKTYTEDGAIIQRINTLPVVSDNDNRLTHSSLKIDFDEGVGLISGQGENPQAMMRYSDDGGQTWSNQLFRSIGKIGQYKTRAVWRKLGVSRERVYEIIVTDPVKVIMKAAYINEPD